MTNREKEILDKLAEALPLMPEAMKERLLGYGDCMADLLNQQSGPVRPVRDYAAARPGA